jgi:hypothetical protein
VEVARIHRCEETLRTGLGRTKISSVGLVVSEELASYGLRTDNAGRRCVLHEGADFGDGVGAWQDGAGAMTRTD